LLSFGFKGLKKELILRVFENRLLRRIFAPRSEKVTEILVFKLFSKKGDNRLLGKLYENF
jgi:hypothetical protein